MSFAGSLSHLMLAMSLAGIFCALPVRLDRHFRFVDGCDFPLNRLAGAADVDGVDGPQWRGRQSDGRSENGEDSEFVHGVRSGESGWELEIREFMCLSAGLVFWHFLLF